MFQLRKILTHSLEYPAINGCKLITLSVLLMLSNVKMLSGLKCVCNPNDCDVIRQDDCPGKGFIVWDPCKCCKVCAKVEGEACGGPGGFSGSCEPPLKCIIKPPIVGTGVCMDLPTADEIDPTSLHRKLRKCQETVKIEPGCEIVERKCQCWQHPISVCKENLIKWDFQNVQECELNLINLVKSEVEFDEDYTTSSKSYDFLKILATR